MEARTLRAGLALEGPHTPNRHWSVQSDCASAKRVPLAMPVQKHTLGLPVPVLSFDGFSTELKLGRFSYARRAGMDTAARLRPRPSGGLVVHVALGRRDDVHRLPRAPLVPAALRSPWASFGRPLRGLQIAAETWLCFQSPCLTGSASSMILAIAPLAGSPHTSFCTPRLLPWAAKARFAAQGFDAVEVKRVFHGARFAGEWVANRARFEVQKCRITTLGNRGYTQRGGRSRSCSTSVSPKRNATASPRWVWQTNW